MEERLSLTRRPARRGRTRLVMSAWALAVLTGCASLPAPTNPPQTGTDVPADHADSRPDADVGRAAAPDTTPAAAPSAPPAGDANQPSGPSTNAADVIREAGPAPRESPPPSDLDTLIVEITSQRDSDLWQRVRRGFAIPDLDDPLVRRREQYYGTRPDYVRRMTERAGRYLYYIVEEVDKRGLPTELALLPFIESAFNPQALSSAKASGIWQFIPSTGRHFDLTQNLFRDDRRDVVASTQAALDYLQKLHGMFGDWHLALAAYNWGEGNVSRAIARNRAAGRSTDYQSLRLPTETRDYVPKLQAIENIIANPAGFGVELPRLEDHPYFTSVPIMRDIDVDLAAELAGMRLEDFKALNPQMNKPVILAAGTPKILLPHDHAEQFVIRLRDHPGPLASWTAWIAPSTMSVTAAAQRVGVSEEELRTFNRIPPRMMVRAGSAMLVPRASHKDADVPEHVAENGVLSLAPEPSSRRRVVVRAGANDTLASIARRHGVSAREVAEWNKTTPGSRLRKGQTIVVYASTPGPRAARAAGDAPRRPSASRHATRTAKADVRPQRPAKRPAATASGARPQARAGTRVATSR